MVKTVLLAEDDELLANLLQYRLEKGGYAVIHENTGKKVIERLQNCTPDIIISDILMPYYSGIELLDFIRTQLKLIMPIILISSANNEANIISAFSLGANDFIAKPISPSELMVRIEKQLATKTFVV